MTNATSLRSCNVCGHEELQPLARRSDGVVVLRCTRCRMGVIERIPPDLMALYHDGYYGIGDAGRDEIRYGYEDYAYTAEHSVSWAAALIKLLKPGGRVLDIGCADGHMLAMLGPRYETYGIEANQSMGRRAAQRGFVVIGRDLLDPSVVGAYAQRFDIVTAIALFEHLRDFRGGVQAALCLMKDDGLLIFEVPLISDRFDNSTWLTSSFEHVYYPSEDALRRLVETELGFRLVGAETHIRSYASTYVGLVFRNIDEVPRMRELLARLTSDGAPPASTEERVARFLLRLVHAAFSSPDDVEALADLPPDAIRPLLLRRLAWLWQADLRRLESVVADRHAAGEALEREATRAQRLEDDLAAATADRRLNTAQLTNSLVAAQLSLQTVTAAAEELRGRVAELKAELEAAQETLRTLQASTARRLAMLASKTVPSYCVGGMRMAWSTLRGQVFFRPHVHRAHPPGAAAPATSPVDESEPQPERIPALPLRLLESTGHMPPLVSSEPEPWPAGRPLVSIVIPSFNYGHFVEEAVDSALEQTFQALEVIVVEGGSTDLNSRRLVVKLCRPRTRVLLHGDPHRVGANRNLGISQARGKYICCLDADDQLRPTYIEKAVFLLDHYGYDVVSCAQQSFGLCSDFIPTLERPDLEDLLRNNHILTCAVFRRALWEKAGGFRDSDPSTTGYVYEDWSFWVRLAALGARFINMARDPLFLYRSHGSSLSSGPSVLPIERQRALIHEMNSDVLDNEAITRSKQRAMQRRLGPTSLDKLCSNHTCERPERPVVLLAMPFLILGGAEKLLSSLVAHLVSVGWRVVVLTSVDAGAEEGDTTAWFEAHTKEVFHLPRFLPPEHWDDFLRYLFVSRRIDILWTAGSAYAYDRLRALKSEFPHVRVADLLFNTLAHTANNRWRRDLIDLHLVENEEVRHWLLERGEAESRIRFVASGVDLERLRPTTRSTDLLQRIGALPGDVLVGFAGRWSEEKDPLGFVEIAHRVDPALPVRFVMTGTGHLRPALERAVAEAGFADGRFHLIGEVPDVSAYLASYDLLVLPSRVDGRPMVVLEALAMGVPVLASRVGALPELIEDGTTGWLCEPGDIESFVGHIDRLGRAPAELLPMRRAARTFAEAHLDARTMFTTYEDALRGLIAGAQPQTAVAP